MGSKSNQMETDVLTYFYSASASTRPSAWNLALYTDAGTVNDPGPVTEATSGNCPGYSRKSITSWTISGNQAQNAVGVSFTASGGAWATVRYWAIIDQSGRMLHWGALNADQTLADTNVLDFPINSIVCNED